MSRSEFVVVAEVVKAVGLKGELKLYPMLDWYEPLLESDELLWDDRTPVFCERWRAQGPCFVVATDDASDRNEAEALVGRTIGFLRSRYADPDFPKPPRGLPFRWLGREVVTTEGERLGEVDEVRLHGAQHSLVIPKAGYEILIPAVPAILVAEDGLDGPLTVDLPEGLLDVALG
jgi:16S rRNA processing protein RimM